MHAFVKGLHISIRDTPLVNRWGKILIDHILRCFKTHFREATLFFQRQQHWIAKTYFPNDPKALRWPTNMKFSTGRTTILGIVWKNPNVGYPICILEALELCRSLDLQRFGHILTVIGFAVALSGQFPFTCWTNPQFLEAYLAPKQNNSLELRSGPSEVASFSQRKQSAAASLV